MKMIRKTMIFLFSFALCVSFLLPLSGPGIAMAANTTTSEQFIYDKAGLLTLDEVSELEAMCQSYGQDTGIEIMILTNNDPSAVSAEQYIEDFNDTLPDEDRVLLLVDLYTRDVLIQGYGKCETYLHSKRNQVIVDDITPYLQNGDYVSAFEDYIKSAAAYMKDDSVLNTDHDYSYDASGNKVSSGVSGNAASVLTYWWVQLIIALVIGAVAVGIMAFHSGGRMTAGSNNYFDPGHSGIIGRRDQYLRTQVTRVRRPQQNNNSGKGGFNAGGFSGGVSAGGRSHSSGGGKF